MLSSLPSLAPRDSYTLWYTSSYSPNTATSAILDSANPNALSIASGAPDAAANNGLAGANRRVPTALLQRSPLARLRADEQYMERRKANVKNYGNSWLKPPGIMKTLFQLQEEEREMKEHEEAMRRERLVQELAEAEAEAAGVGEAEGPQGEGGEQEDELGMESRDLDDDIPEADAPGGLTDSDDSAEDEDEDDSVPVQRVPEQAYREALSGQMDGGLSDDDDHDTAPQMREMMRAQIMTEEDVIQHDEESLGMAGNLSEDEAQGQEWGSDVDMDLGMDMDADLDDEVPEAEELGEYEHTDTDESLESSDSEDPESADDAGLENGSHPAASERGQPFSSSIVRSDDTPQSVELSRDDMTQSSFLGSSPGLQRGRGRGG